MLKIPAHIYIASENVDMRKSIDGLASVVEKSFVSVKRGTPIVIKRRLT